jgi:hypothetical protein
MREQAILERESGRRDRRRRERSEHVLRDMKVIRLNVYERLNESTRSPTIKSKRSKDCS